MATIEDIMMIKNALSLLETDINTWNSNDDEIDYEDLKKSIYDLQDSIKSIVDYWEV